MVLVVEPVVALKVVVFVVAASSVVSVASAELVASVVALIVDYTVVDLFELRNSDRKATKSGTSTDKAVAVDYYCYSFFIAKSVVGLYMLVGCLFNFYFIKEIFNHLMIHRCQER